MSKAPLFHYFKCDFIEDTFLMHFSIEDPFELPQCTEASYSCTLSKRVKITCLGLRAADRQLKTLMPCNDAPCGSLGSFVKHVSFVQSERKLQLLYYINVQG